MLEGVVGSETVEQSAAKVVRTLELLGYLEPVAGLPLKDGAEEEIRERLERIGAKAVEG